MSLNPRVCKKSYKVHIPMMGEECEFWLITVTDEQSITNPDKDHAYLTDDGKLFVFNGDSLVRVNCDICFTQEEREKLEGIEEGANKYVLPVASSTELGGVLLGYTQNGRNYPITKDTKGNIYVNVPWEEYQLPKATDNALGGIKTGYKQNGKFYPIKTDTDGNAYVQVPWEDTNTVYEVVSKTSNGLMPMLPSDENASKRFLNGDGEWVVGTDNSINGVTQTGSTFSGETSDCGVQITRVVGKTSQKTTNGYQLFDASKLPTKSAGGVTVTNNNDGSFTVSGSGTLTGIYGNSYTLSNEETKQLFKVGNLYLKDALSANQFYFEVQFKSTSGNLYLKNNQTIELTEEIMSDATSIILIYGASGATIPNATFKPMLYQDGDGTWEQYTGGKPAPNPDYPMEIENVEISKLFSFGGNMFDIDRTFSGAHCKETKLSEQEIKVEVTSESTYQSRYYDLNENEMEFLKGKLVGMYREISERSGAFPTFQLIVTSPSGTIYAKDETTIPKNVTNIRIGLYVNNSSSTVPVGSYVVFKNIKLMVSDTENTEWTPYGFSNTQTSLTLAQDDIYQEGTITRARKQVVFDGSSDESWLNFVENTRVQCQLDTDIRANIAVNINGYCNRAIYNKTGLTNELKNNEFTIISSKDYGGARLIIRIPSDISTLEEWKALLSTHNLIVEYELATPTTEEFKVPTIPSYYPYTNVSTDSKVEPEITFKPLPYTTCLVGEATEEESGYMPKLSGNASQFLNGQGEWSTPSGYTLPTASTSQLGGVKIGSNISISDGAISIDKDNVTKALGYTPPTTNTTYEKVDKSSDGLCPKLPNETTTTKYLRQDGAWEVPPNTTYEVASTSANGLMSSSDKTKLTNLRRIWKGTSSSPPSGWVDGDIYVQYEE